MTTDFKKHIVDTIAQIVGNRNILAIPVAFIDATESIEAALFLSQLLYWTDRSTLAGGWVAKTYDEWHEEIRLSKYQISKAANSLSIAGIRTKVAKWNGAPTVHYRIEKEEFSQWIVKKLDERKSRNLTNESQETSQSYTETTAETTTVTANAVQSEINPLPENRKVDKRKTRTPRKRDVLFDAVAAHIFKFSGDVNPKAGGHVALVANTIRQCGDGAPDSELASEVRQFVEWWAVRYPNTDVPMSDSKIAVHWQAWRNSKTTESPFKQALRAAKYEVWKPS